VFFYASLFSICKTIKVFENFRKWNKTIS
jgi:hypothetical protein